MDGAVRHRASRTRVNALEAYCALRDLLRAVGRNKRREAERIAPREMDGAVRPRASRTRVNALEAYCALRDLLRAGQSLPARPQHSSCGAISGAKRSAL